MNAYKKLLCVVSLFYDVGITILETHFTNILTEIKRSKRT